MFHRTATLPRRAVAAGTAAMVALSLGSLAAGAAQAGRPDAVTTGASSAAAARQAPGPIHAGNMFGWYGHGGLVYDETFVGPLNHKRWRVEGPGAVRTQHGMLTLNTAHKGTVSAQMTIPGRAYGRWETRLRQRQYGHGHTPYRVLTELVPATKDGERCGEQNIGLNRFKVGGHETKFYIRTRPNNLYQASYKRSFGQDQWHTFAVEVTPKRISWFVDAHVVRTERRPEALSGRKFQVRFSMMAVKGKQMNKARMQMDWLRYWTLQAPNERSTKAPATKLTKYTLACPPDVAPH